MSSPLKAYGKGRKSSPDRTAITKDDPFNESPFWKTYAEGLKYSPDGTTINKEDPFTEYDGEVQPPINHRLEQIKIFLADDDNKRDPEFKEKLEKCRKYIREISLTSMEGRDYSGGLVYTVKQQMAMHEKWIREAEKTAEVDFDDQVKHEDPGSEGRLMPTWWEAEPSAVDERMGGLGLANDVGWGQHGPAEAKAHVADSDVAMEDRPDSTPNDNFQFSSSPPDNVLPSVKDPWHYTKAVEHVNREIMAYALTRYVEADKTFDSDGNEISPFAWNPMPTDFLHPFSPPSADHLLSSWSEYHARLGKLIGSLMDAQHAAPRPILNAICNTLVDEADEWDIAEQAAVSQPGLKELSNRYVCVKDFTIQEYEDLKVFTREARYQKIDQFQMAWRGADLTFAQAVEALRDNYEDYWPQGSDMVIPASEIILKCRSITAQPPYPQISSDRCEEILLSMADENRIQTFRKKGTDGRDTGILGVGRPLPNDFPEARHNFSQDIGYWTNVAKRIVRVYRTLNRNLQQHDADSSYMKDVVLPDFTENLRLRTRLWEHKVGYEPLLMKWVEIARPLESPRKRDSLSVLGARELLMQRLLDESALAREQKMTRGPGKVWNWRENRWYQDPGARFHQWDKEKQSEGQEQRTIIELEMKDQLRADANRGVKTVKFEAEYPEPDRMEMDEPAESNCFPNKVAFFPLPESQRVMRVMQEDITGRVPQLTEVERERLRRAEELREKAERRQARRNAQGNKRRASEDEIDASQSPLLPRRSKRVKNNTGAAKAPSA